ncbi:MAG TPA: sulfotransferase [Chitinophagales bacterium]|nr:sulfotransferase [Chitinophagales bacterium]
MSFIHASIFYIHIKTFAKIVYLQCFKHFSIRRFLITILFVALFVVVSAVVLVFRLLDEILYPNYRKLKIEKPVFIIANPRSGTTFLHRLFCLDEERYGYTLLYHTIFPSITIFKIIDFLGKIDRKIGRPMRKTFDYLDGVFFKGWEDIHPMGFNQSEEDEGTFIFTLITSGIFLLCPYMDEIDYVKFPDLMSDKERKKLSAYYKSSIQRFMYALGSDKIFLSKNVMSTGRLNTIIDLFPDARIVYIVRSPYKAVPSFISMFSAAWKLHSPEIPETSKYHRAWGDLAINYYLYFHENIQRLPEKQWYTLKYEDLVENPHGEMTKIYNHFDMNVSDTFNERLQNASGRSKNYRSGHSYSLEQYGMTKNDVLSELEPIFDKYKFEK